MARRKTPATPPPREKPPEHDIRDRFPTYCGVCGRGPLSRLDFRGAARCRDHPRTTT